MSDTQTISGTMTQAGNVVTLAQQKRPMPVLAWAMVDGPAGSTIVFEASQDGATWTAVLAERPDDGIEQGTITLPSAAKQLWYFRMIFGRSLRVRCTSISSGTITVRLDMPLIAHWQFLQGNLPPGSNLLPTALGGEPAAGPQVALQ